MKALAAIFRNCDKCAIISLVRNRLIQVYIVRVFLPIQVLGRESGLWNVLQELFSQVLIIIKGIETRMMYK